MKACKLHDWAISPSRAIEIQRELAGRVERGGEPGEVRLIAGVDVSVSRRTGMAQAAVVLLSFPGLDPLEACTTESEVRFPYVPGLLSFREAPVILEAFEDLTRVPDLIMVDGHGLAHPRRFGLASHLGLLWGRPTIGCAKSRLCGEHEPPGIDRGSQAALIDRGETIGIVLRTRTGVKPLFVSTGHLISLEAAVKWVLACGCGYRLPEPTRLAHQAAGGKHLI